ncbi:unnamed protein product [Rotaria sp. Silwood2]|nr:unnamed protein product [Rotaria sp. Silwood2]CAF3996065.1 unnamed protein product [Rotaria sp. Silwood2]
MSKVFISRPEGNVAWGFRLQGGFEYNEPLTITNIVPNSPADGKIDPDDMLIEIAGNNVTQMTHKDALELIQRCGNALFLTVQKAGYSNPPDTIQTEGLADQQQQQPSYSYDSSSTPWNNVSSMPMENTPQTPTYNANLMTKKKKPFLIKHQSLNETYPSYQETTDASNLSPILAKYLSRPGGPKPFTYIPGGVDLSKMRESSRTRRYRDYRSISEEEPIIDPTMNRRMIVPSDQFNQHHYTTINPIQPFSYSRQQPTSPKKNIQHDTDVITQSRSFQMLQGWISDSEKTVPTAIPSPLSQSTTNRSAVDQAIHDQQNKANRRHSSSGGVSSLPSRTFRYLQEQYSVDNDDIMTVPKKPIEEPIISKNGTGLRRGSDAHNPSRAFKFLQEQYDISQELSINQSRTVNNRDDLLEIYNKPPPSFREHEPEAPHYKGSTVPSRAFRFLQMMTQEDDDEQNNSKPNNNYTKSQQLLNKYDEHSVSAHTNRLNEHPSRSFKYLQELTGEHPSTSDHTGIFEKMNFLILK